MGHLIILVGVSGSGKSTWALDQQTDPNSTDEYTVHSSDEIRKELFGDAKVTGKNEEVFAEMKSRTIRDLKEGKDVIYDATNLNRRIRAALYRDIKDAGFRVGICLFTVPLEELKRRRTDVPEERIVRMYKSMQPPRIGVDCDVFMLDGEPYFEDSILDNGLRNLEDIIKATINEDIKRELCLNYDNHDTPHHLESIDEHIKMTIDASKTHAMSNIAAFHDLGKGVCKVEGTFREHQNVGAIYMLNAIGFSKNYATLTTSFDYVEIIYQHMNAHGQQGGEPGLTPRVIRRNALDDKLVSIINKFAIEVDGPSRVTKEVE